MARFVRGGEFFDVWLEPGPPPDEWRVRLVSRPGAKATPGPLAGTAWDAQNGYARLQLEHLQAGWTREVDPDREADFDEPCNAELDAALVAKPGDVATLLVYADWLQQRGHPRGALITTQHARVLADSPELGGSGTARGACRRAARPARRHDSRGRARSRLHAGVGSRLPRVRAPRWLSRPRRVRGQPLAPAAPSVVAVSPHARDRLPSSRRPGQHVDLRDADARRGDASTPAPRDRRFRSARLRWHRHLARTDRRPLPAVDRIPAPRGGHRQGHRRRRPRRARSPVRTRVRDPDVDPTRDNAGRDLLPRWPALEELELWIGSDQYGGDCTLDDLAPVFEATRFPALRRLRIMNTQLSDEICPLIASSSLAAQLEQLDFSLGTLSDAGAAMLAGARDRFPQLRALDVFHCALSTAGLDQLRRAGYPVQEVAPAKRWELNPRRQKPHRYITDAE